MSEDTVHQHAARKVAHATRSATCLLLDAGLKRLQEGASPDEVADCVNEAVFFMGWWEKAQGTLQAYTEAAEQDGDA